ncbi:hypothetical protein SAMN05444395_102523 [Flavobacterium fryxellicola]|uniref:Uncharacterized protein n=1 Tax=Flavobacterium fryxellicola TaxID=249352 RepID=A0A167XX54_9FLAO|nr:hypothetical protein [Flavobacterium fryxellicola]OAB28779.1 hypothetical protein FBFR_04725 [Flavobacterium fryxellicola]SHN61795.1 hypothetical protein SAMN05444395_102523 [Flavobacterium fryxellicola]
MKYFGYINKETFKVLNNTEKLNFLINNSLFVYSLDPIHTSNPFTQEEIASMSMVKKQLLVMSVISSMAQESGKGDDCFYFTDQDHNNIGIFIQENKKTKCVKIEPTQSFLDEFYEDLTKKYEDKILSEKYQFYEKFNDDIFGLDHKKQIKLALKSYKEIYKSLHQDDNTFIGNYVGKKNHDFAIESKLELVVYEKLKYQHSLINLYSYFEYLYGKKSYLKNNFYTINQEIIDSIIKYESRKQIMKDLNDKYNFENNNEIDSKKDINHQAPKNDVIPFLNFIRHENKTEIERIIKLHYSDLRGVSLRYLIEFLIDQQILLINYGDKTKIYESIKILFDNKDIGTPSSVFDLKIDREKDHKYLNAKNNFLNKFDKLL